MGLPVGLTPAAQRNFRLELDEFATLVGLLHARSLVGLDPALFRGFSEADLPRMQAKLHAHGWLQPAERPGTWHFNEDLMQALTVAVAPEFAILVRSQAPARSTVSYLAGDDITEVVVTDEWVLVSAVRGLVELAAHAHVLVNGASGELVVARVVGTYLDAGHRAVVDEAGFMTSRRSTLIPRSKDAWTPANILAFTQAALTTLRSVSPS